MTENAVLSTGYAYTGKYTTDDGATESTNGFAMYDGTCALIVQGRGATVEADTITYKGQKDTDLKHIAVSGCWGVYEGGESGVDKSIYGVMESETLESSKASTYILADTATLTFSDSMPHGASSTTVTKLNVVGAGTVAINTLGSVNHNSAVDLGEYFTGTLRITGGNMQLSSFKLHDDVKLELVSGQSWSDVTIDREVLLNAENIDSSYDFAYSNVTINGKVTGNYLRVTGNDGGFLKLTNSANDIGQVKVTGRKFYFEAGKLGTLTATGGTSYINGGEVGTVNISGGSTDISGGEVVAVNVSGGSTNISGGTVDKIEYLSAGGSVTFSKVQGQQSASYTVTDGIGSTVQTDNFTRTLTIDEGVTVTTGLLKSAWGMGLMTVNGILNVDAISIESGNSSDTNANHISGSGKVTAGSFALSNVGPGKLSVATMNVTGNFSIAPREEKTLTVAGTALTIGGKFSSGSNGRMDVASGSITLSNTKVTHEIGGKVDMAGTQGTYTGNLNLGAGVKVSATTEKNFWLGGKAAVNLEKDAEFTRGDITVIGTGSTSKITRSVTEKNNNDYSSASTTHKISNAVVKNTTAGTQDTPKAVTYANIMDNVGVVNEGANSTLTLTNTANKLNSVDAAKGDITLQNTSKQELSTLAIAAGKTVAVYTGTDTANVGTLTVSGTGSTATFGAEATLNSNLVLGTGATVTLEGALTMGGSLTLSEGLTLGGDLYTAIASMADDSEAVVLFTGVTELLGTNALTRSGEIDFSTYFTNVTSEAGDYYLGYDGNNVYVDFVAKADDPGEDPSNPEGGDTNIPEPTTATLSLLALCGLAARRRRRA